MTPSKRGVSAKLLSLARHTRATVCLLATAVLTSAVARAHGDDLRAKVQNPVGSLISVPIESTFDFGGGCAWSPSTAFDRFR